MKITYIKLKNYIRFPLLDVEIFEHEFKNKITMIAGGNGAGKAQPLNSFIKVPNGWDLMKNMYVGREIVAKDGSISKVTGVFPQGKKDIYKLTFSDGRTARATGDHLWKIYVSDSYPIEAKVVTTLDIINIIENNKRKNRLFIWIDLPDSERNEDKPLPIDPYILGVIIGGGSLASSVVITHPDEFIMNKVKQRLPEDLEVHIRNFKDSKACLAYSIVKSPTGESNSLVTELRKYGLMFKKSHDKFIPDEYLHGSTKQRLELLQGLMDTYGTIGKNGTPSFYTTSITLAQQFKYLVRSLGGSASMSIRNHFYTRNGEKFRGRIAYQINIQYKKPSELFTLPKKRDRINDNNQYARTLKIRIDKIEFDGVEEAQCISIDHPDKLYITDNFVVTHNTSLMSELTPLPADRNNFRKGGYKEIHIEKSGNKYKLISDFTNGSHFSFLVNDQELNESGNVTTQRELTQQHFNITQNIHEILTGLETFTDMSLLARKKLFSSITHLNIDKVLENYNNLKEELKSNELLLKTQTSLLQTEEEKLIDSHHLDSLKEILTRSKEFIDFLLNLRTEVHRYKSTLNMDDVYSKIKSITEKIEDTIAKYYIYITAYPVNELDKYKLDYTNRLSVVKYQLEELYSSLERKQQEYKVLSLTNQSNLSTLIQQKENVLVTIDKLKNSLVYVKDYTGNLSEIRSDLYKLEVSLPDILHSLPTNTLVEGKRKYSKDRYDTLLNRKNELITTLGKLTQQETNLDKELVNLSNTNDFISCPNCQHSWSIKDVPAMIEHTKKHLSEVLNDKIKAQDELTVVNKDIDELVHYFTLYKQYTSLRSSTQHTLKTLWEQIDSQELVFNNPTAILPLVTSMNVEMGTIDTLLDYEKELINLNGNIEVLSSLKDSNLESVLTDIEEMNFTISDIQMYKNHLEQTLATIDKVSTLYTYLNTLNDSLRLSIQQLHSTNTSYLAESLLAIIDSDLSKHKITLIETEKELHKYDTIQYTISKYKKTIQDTQTNIKVLKIVLDELSPKNGLIAKSVSSFLNVIIDNVNNTIASIWDYKMVLKAIDVESEALNYRFKVEVEDRLPISDISIISKGMKEAVNLSFKIVLYKLLGLENYPLYLDELAANLDKVHSNKLIELIHRLSLSETFSQIFLITHKERFEFLSNMETVSLSS